MAALSFCLALAVGVDLEELVRRHDLQWTCDAGTGRHAVRAGRNTIVFSPGLEIGFVNGAVVGLSHPVTVEGGRVKLPLELARHLEAAGPRRPELAPPIAGARAVPPPPAPAAKPVLPGVTIAIDPGHGGMHTGGRGRTLQEKDINLQVSLELQRIFESWGAKVVMTRTKDIHFDAQVDDDLDRRVAIVNAQKPDLFLSIHTNYVATAAPRGFEVWVPLAGGARARESRALAEFILDGLEGVWSAGNNRGIKNEHNLRVLKGTQCPAALVELEFISNPVAERQLAQPEVRRKCAEAIAEAARKWVVNRR